MSKTIGSLGEAGLLRRLRHRFEDGVGLGEPRGVALGVGDDAALLARVRGAAVLSTDMLVEGVDFDFDWARFADVGHKAAAVNLSDLAAMGAKPRGLLVALALRPSDRVDSVLQLLDALHELGAQNGAPVVGGDLSRTRGPLVVCVTAVGEVSAGRALRRGQAQPGDAVLVSGGVGEAAAGLRLLASGERAPRRVCQRQLRPQPQVSLGLALAQWGQVRSCADVSDGLARDALHLPSTGCGITLDVSRLPLSNDLKRASKKLGCDPMELALCGGEDFALVIAVACNRVAQVEALAAAAGAPLTCIGRVERGSGLRLIGGDPGLLDRVGGFDHFV